MGNDSALDCLESERADCPFFYPLKEPSPGTYTKLVYWSTVESSGALGSGAASILTYDLSPQAAKLWRTRIGVAFCGFLHIEGLRDSLGFAIDLAKRARLDVAPGSAFSSAGDTHADSYLRICFAHDAKRIGTGLERLGKAVAEI